MEYKVRLRYSPIFASKKFYDFMTCNENHVSMVAHTYVHEPTQVEVTVIPLAHYAHPKFYQQVDSLCCQHDSVLMEGRHPTTGSPHSTLVPPREFKDSVVPADELDSEGWEPQDPAAYWQPFSWGVKGSPNFTVVHAADRYDYEWLPWWASLRFNLPFVGGYAREKHCLDMIPVLYANGYRKFAIPWGLGHATVFHDMLVDNGFEVRGMTSVILWTRSDGDKSAMEHSRLQWRWSEAQKIGYRFQYVVAAVVVYLIGSRFVSVEWNSHRPSDIAGYEAPRR